MAFTNVGPIVTLAPGETVYWAYWFKNNKDHGEQHAGPDLKSSSGLLIAFEQGKEGWGFNEGGAVLFFRYRVTIRNAGTITVGHNIQGGGSV